MSQNRRLYQLFGMTAQWLGLNNEKRVLAAFTTEAPEWIRKIPWICGARHASEMEDNAGIDIVFSTDVGEIKLQVKSSENARAEFVRRQMRGEVGADIITVSVSPSHDATALCHIILPLLSAERKKRIGAQPKNLFRS